MKLVRLVIWSLAILALGACAANPPTGPSASASSAAPAPTPGASPVAPSVSGSRTAERCSATDSVVVHHDAPSLEATLPTRVAGRDLATWSVGGRCWLEFLFDDDAVIEQILANTSDPSALDLSHLAQAVAGRSDTAADPPYFVLAAHRPEQADEIDLTLVLLLGGARFHDVEAGSDLRNYETVTIAGKEVYVGTADMLDQTEHQRGKPYLYQTDDAMFIVITDDDAWAEDAIGQLP